MISFRDYKSDRFKALPEKQQEEIITDAYAHIGFEKSVRDEYQTMLERESKVNLRPPLTSMIPLLKRVGLIKITEYLYEEFWRNMPQGLLIPIEIGYDFKVQSFKIYAYSQLFEDVSEGDIINTYTAVFFKSPTGKVTFQRFDKV